MGKHAAALVVYSVALVRADAAPMTAPRRLCTVESRNLIHWATLLFADSILGVAAVMRRSAAREAERLGQHERYGRADHRR